MSNSDFLESDLTERRLVWEALSELFLDTDTTLFEHIIVDKLAASPYDIDEIEKIFTYEVTPVCMWNVFAWEWLGFDIEWLEKEIKRTQESRLRFLYNPILFYVKYKLKFSRQWKRIVSKVLKKRNSSDSKSA